MILNVMETDYSWVFTDWLGHIYIIGFLMFKHELWFEEKVTENQTVI